MLIPGSILEIVPVWFSLWFSVGIPGNREGKLVLKRAEPCLSSPLPKLFGAVQRSAQLRDSTLLRQQPYYSSY